ncbi:MAG: ABC transporter substrate-binding protein [Lachnospiraceae bacterium]|nr:ABC transporter substrate-binding protein [Lachnospiraceae bacterium]
MKKRILALLLSSAMVVTALSGCGGGTTSAESNENSTESADAESESVNSGTESESSTVTISADSEVYSADEVTTGGTLRIGTTQNPSVVGYTPEITSNSHIQFLRCAYESLLYYDEDGNLTGQLATDWETNADDCTISFTLMEGVQFSDGTDFNAEAVKWNIEQYQEAGRSEVSYIESIEVIGDYSVLIHLNSWNSSALECIGFFVYYMSPSAYEENGVDWMRVNSAGTGPFIVTDFEQGVSVSYEKNENYRVEGQPYLDGIEYTIYADVTTVENAMLANEIDVITYGGDVDMITHLADEEDILISRNENGLGAESVGLITSSADEDDPFYDARVRQAFCYAVDYDSIIEALSYGIYTVTDQWAVPGSVTYNTDMEGYSYDPEKAKELLAEAGYADGFETTIYTTNNGFYQNVVQAVSAQLAEVGITANVEIVDSATMNSQMTDGWNGITWHFASIGPDLGLYMARHLSEDGSYYAPGIQHPQDCLDLLSEVQSATDEDSKMALEWELMEKVYGEQALFGRTMYVSLIVHERYDYVKGGQFGLVHAATWSPATTWMDK